MLVLSGLSMTENNLMDSEMIDKHKKNTLRLSAVRYHAYIQNMYIT